jgi:hypothetical protein
MNDVCFAADCSRAIHCNTLIERNSVDEPVFFQAYLIVALTDQTDFGLRYSDFVERSLSHRVLSSNRGCDEGLEVGIPLQTCRRQYVMPQSKLVNRR